MVGVGTVERQQPRIRAETPVNQGTTKTADGTEQAQVPRDGFERSTSTAARGDSSTHPAADPSLQEEAQARLRGVSVASVSAASVVQASPEELIEGSKNTYAAASHQLAAGDGEAAARILNDGARDLRAGMDGPLGASGGGPPPFSKADRSRFLQTLDRVLVAMGRG